jgi:hypothetical protein
MPDDLERFTNSVARQLRGEPAPERDNIGDRTDDAYLAALQRERAYDADDDGEDDGLEEEQRPSSLDEELRALAAGAVARWTAAPDNADDDEALEEAETGSDADWQPALDAWAAALTAADRERIDAGGPEAAQASFATFVEQQAAREQFERMRSGAPDTEAEAEGGDEPMPATGAEFVDWAHQNASRIRAEFGMSVPQYLAAMAGANEAEWAEVVRESGVGRDAKPGYMQIGPRSQMELIKADLERDMERTRERGGHW